MSSQLLRVTSRNKTAPTVDLQRQQVLGLTDLSVDAWGRQKVITDYSLYQGIWTYSIPSDSWVEYYNGVELLSFTNFSSVNSMLKCTGIAGNIITLSSRRHPRYQANRGHLYSVSMILPDATNGSTYNFGMYTNEAGVMFRVISGNLYAVRRTLYNSIVTEYVELITLPDGCDLTKGHIYDIQMQWRGVGGISFFIDQKLVHSMDLLGTLDAVSVSNPAMPITFEVIGTGVMYSICADITSEGGNKESRHRGSVDTGELSIGVTEVPMLLVHLPDTVTYDGVQVTNTRDIALRRISAFADGNTILRVYTTRLSSKFVGTTFTNYSPLGYLKYAADGAIVLTGGTTNLQRLATRRIPANGSLDITNPDEQYGEFFMTHGDYLLITMQAKLNTLGGCSAEWGVEI